MRCVLWAACLAAGAWTAASAACERDYVAVTGTNLGYNAFHDEEGRLVGISVDLFAELGRRTGCRITLEEMPPARIEAMARLGHIAILAIASQRFREGRIYVPLIAATTDMVIRREVGASSVAAARDNKRVTFGRIDGLTYGKWGDAFFAALDPSRIDPSVSPDVLYRKLAAGRIDATFGFSILYQQDLDRYHLREAVQTIPVTDAPRTLGGVVLTPWQFDPDDLRKLQAALLGIRDDGTFMRILTHWVGAETARDQVWRAARDGG
ncbi:MAG: transporter substrate-binding domain-containing protein [Burkholderiales bacterium]|nr:transporter substrate-binding domain-containing protein [Burkholderiales bacterium]